MRVGVVAFAIASAACGPGSGTNPEYPLPVFPPQVFVTEGEMTSFLIGLDGGPQDGVGGSMYTEGHGYCRNTYIEFTPCDFSLDPDKPYPAKMAVRAGFEGDAMNNMVKVSVYLHGEIAEPGHEMLVTTIDIHAPTVLASNWNVQLDADDAGELTVRLAKPPSGDVVVTLRPDTVDVTPLSLTFGPTTFDVPQTVTVRGAPGIRTGLVDLLPSDPTIAAGTVHVVGEFVD